MPIKIIGCRAALRQKAQPLMRGLYEYRIGRLSVKTTARPTERRAFCLEQTAHSSVQAGGEAGLSG